MGVANHREQDLPDTQWVELQIGPSQWERTQPSDVSGHTAIGHQSGRGFILTLTLVGVATHHHAP